MTYVILMKTAGILQQPLKAHLSPFTNFLPSSPPYSIIRLPSVQGKGLSRLKQLFPERKKLCF